MGETDYNALLYDKMKAEQDKYRDWLLSQPPEEILNHTYEYTMREDIVMCMEELELSPKQAKALLRSPCPLDDVYKEFKDREVEHMDNKLTETGSSNRRVAAVPIWVKPYLTIEEAAEYTGIGRDKLYEMTSLADCPFVLWVGNRRMIKRRIFDEYIEQMYSI